MKETIALAKSQRQRRESGRDRKRGNKTDTCNMRKSEIPDRCSVQHWLKTILWPDLVREGEAKQGSFTRDQTHSGYEHVEWPRGSGGRRSINILRRPSKISSGDAEAEP
eukprot:5171890-Pyramimonas_sp.AAC.1